MTNAAYDTSDYQGSPVDFFEFSIAGANWDYNSGDIDVTIGPKTYKSAQLRRDPTTDNQELSKQNISIFADMNIDFLDIYKSYPPNDVVSVNIKQYHFNDPDEQLIVVFPGRVTDVKFYEEETEILCESLITSLQRNLLRRLYQRNCPHVLYGSQCQVNKISYKVDAVLSNINSNVLTSTAFNLGTNHFTGGYVEIVKLGVTYRRFIIAHSGNDITLNYPFNLISIGDTVSAFPGCDHTIDTCNTKYSNEINYGGQIHYSEINPMGGVSIF